MTLTYRTVNEGGSSSGAVNKPPFIRTNLHSKLVERVCIASGQAKRVTDLCSNSKQ